MVGTAHAVIVNVGEAPHLVVAIMSDVSIWGYLLSETVKGIEDVPPYGGGGVRYGGTDGIEVVLGSVDEDEWAD